MALKNAPPDKAKMEEIRGKRQKQAQDLTKVVDGGTSTTDVVADAVVIGLSKLTGEAGVDGPKT